MPQEQLKLIGTKAISFSLHFSSLLFSACLLHFHPLPSLSIVIPTPRLTSNALLVHVLKNKTSDNPKA